MIDRTGLEQQTVDELEWPPTQAHLGKLDDACIAAMLASYAIALWTGSLSKAFWYDKSCMACHAASPGILTGVMRDECHGHR